MLQEKHLSNMTVENILAEPKLKVTPGCSPTPPNQHPTKCQPSTPYAIQEIARQYFKTHDHCDMVKSRSHHDVAQKISKQCPY